MEEKVQYRYTNNLFKLGWQKEQYFLYTLASSEFTLSRPV